MSMAIDAAMYMANLSIDRATENEKYYLNYMKLHQFLYLAQCYMLKNYGMEMFDDKIFATFSGPHVDGIGYITSTRGIDNITEKFPYNRIFTPTASRRHTLMAILDVYGCYTPSDIVTLTKNTPAYQHYKERITKTFNPEILQNIMQKDQGLTNVENQDPWLKDHNSFKVKTLKLHKSM